MIPAPVPSRQRMLIPLEVYIDFICPWCYIVKRSLDFAMAKFIERHPEVEFELSWRPFYVAPMLKTSCKTLAFYNSAIPDPEKLRSLMVRLKAAAAATYNTQFDFSGNLGPTRDAHKLVALALRRGGRAAASRMVELLMHTQFIEGNDVSQEEVLVRVAAAAMGLAAQDVQLELADEDATKRMDRDVEETREVRDIEAVPCVTVLGRFKVGGFQEEQVFSDLFAKIYEEKMTSS